ncbi:zinc metalloprotease HtpX [Longimicrobium sp.]|uniref:zinc metalloprotease HtpX n=1 Tax=Longimicrobium sp. TaxID=2029185 RepID=UPI002E3501F7|nr:zinc metalloprotease HtpX [Longimicrobium sp.]HEX6037646.1 zinc metalloprotease HtpX [Longimicrobium sp.]
MNNVKVFGLMALLTALVAAVGGAVGGRGGLVIALVLAGAMNLFAYWNSARMVLRMYGAHEVSRESAPWLYEMVDRLRQRAGLPMPVVAVAPHAQPNAFATGRNPEHAVVCVTEGLLQLVAPDELEGVIAHELAHIKNRDMLLQTFTATLAGAVSSLGQNAIWSSLFGGDEEDGGGGIVFALLAPVAAGLVQMAISRQREFKADAVGAEICGRPLALAGALRKLDDYAHRIPMEVSPAVAPLAQVNPLSSFGGGVARMFSTHPPTEDRVRRLEQLARAA